MNRENKMFEVRPLFLSGLILLIALSRLAPHPINFSPLGAMALFAAAHFEKRWQAFAVPLLAAFVSDLILNYARYSSYPLLHSGFFWQYGSYALTVLLGIFWFRNVSVSRVLGGAIWSSVLFFLLSNFGVWAEGALYPMDGNGLFSCYVAGVPFFRGTLLGNLFYSGLLFGGFAFLSRRLPSLQRG